MLAELAGKAFLFYHGFCCQPAYLLSLRQPKTPEISAKKMFSVSPKKDKVLHTCSVTECMYPLPLVGKLPQQCANKGERH